MRNATGFWRIAVLPIILFLGTAGVIGYKLTAGSSTACPRNPRIVKSHRGCPHRAGLCKEWHKGQIDKEAHERHSHLSHPARCGCCCNRPEDD